jgi:hypothetical protein
MANWIKEEVRFPERGRPRSAARGRRRENRPAHIQALLTANLPFDDGLSQISQAPVVQDAIQRW